MPKRIRIRRLILQAVECAAVSLCVVPRAMIADGCHERNMRMASYLFAALKRKANVALRNQH